MTDTIDSGNEICYVVCGRWLSDDLWIGKGLWKQEGHPAHVGFGDLYNKIISRKDHVIGFYHTHPNMPAFTSRTDINTMDQWVDVLGKPLLCLIEGVDGLKTYYWLGEGAYQIGNSYRYENVFAGNK